MESVLYMWEKGKAPMRRKRLAFYLMPDIAIGDLQSGFRPAGAKVTWCKLA